MKKIPLLFSVLFAVNLCLAADSAAPKSLLIENARVAVIGDSITEQKLYSKYIELYLPARTGTSAIRSWNADRNSPRQ